MSASAQPARSADHAVGAIASAVARADALAVAFEHSTPSESAVIVITSGFWVTTFNILTAAWPSVDRPHDKVDILNRSPRRRARRWG